MKFDRQIEITLQSAAHKMATGPVLVVDDSQLQRRILSSILKRMGHEGIEAATATEALDLCRTGQVSIVISDWMMPEMDGLQFCRALRKLGQDSYVYFILLASEIDKGEIAQGFDAGADDFLTKPVNDHNLRARIAAGQRILSMQGALQEKNRVVEATLEELRGIYDAIDRDLIEARKLQQSLIREPIQEHDGATVRLLMQSSGRVGGDLVGSYPIAPGRIGVYSIDVSGHGVASALLCARLAGYLSPTAPEQNIAIAKTSRGYAGIPPAEVVVMLNHLILDEIETEHYFTICLAEVDLEQGEVLMCQAGHPPPAVQRRDGSVEFLGDGGFPVGLIPDAAYTQERVTLRAGDRILFYSDGITECADPNGVMLYNRGLADILSLSHANPDRAFFDVLIEGLEIYSDGADFGDDISAVLLDYRG